MPGGVGGVCNDAITTSRPDVSPSAGPGSPARAGRSPGTGSERRKGEVSDEGSRTVEHLAEDVAAARRRFLAEHVPAATLAEYARLKAEGHIGEAEGVSLPGPDRTLTVRFVAAPREADARLVSHALPRSRPREHRSTTRRASRASPGSSSDPDEAEPPLAARSGGRASLPGCGRDRRAGKRVRRGCVSLRRGRPQCSHPRRRERQPPGRSPGHDEACEAPDLVAGKWSQGASGTTSASCSGPRA